MLVLRATNEQMRNFLPLPAQGCTNLLVCDNTRKMSRELSNWIMLLLAALGVAGTASCSASTGSDPQVQSPSMSTGELVDCSTQRCVALTFDDGPDQFTDELLNTLKTTDTPATFFLIGSKVQNFPGSLERMATEGHQIGSHTWDHSDITTLSEQQLKEQLERTDAAIKKITGQSPSLFRPPLGHHDQAHNQLIPYPLVLWDTHSHDGRIKDPEKIVDAVVDTVQPGSIILMHDPRKATVQAVPEMVSKLRAKGYAPVRVDQLFAGEMENSVVYSSAPHDPAQQ